MTSRWTQTFSLQTVEVDPLLALTVMTASGCLPCQITDAKQRNGSESNGLKFRLRNGSLTAAPTLSAAPQQDADEDLAAGEASPESPSGRAHWSGVIGVEGELTGDGRMIDKNALRWENLPLPLRYVSSDVGAHDGAMVVGTIDKITRSSNGQILGEGSMDNGTAEAIEAQRQVGENLTNGISMDLDDVSFEVRVAAELLENDAIGLGMGLLLAEDDEERPFTDPDGNPCNPDTDGPDCTQDGPVLEKDEEGRVKVAEMKSDDEVRVTTDGRIRAATIVAIPAFASAQIHLDGDVLPATPAQEAQPALVASAAPKLPPRKWFTHPGLQEPTALVVTEEGQVYGHIATWDTCHIGAPMSHTAQGKCVTPPRSNANYNYFRTGVCLTDEGEVAVGHLTLDTRHASGGLTAASALSHYENTGTAIADVNVGEDHHGIWVAGALRPSATERQIRSLRSAPMSGDWRLIGSGLELVAVLAVNVPGFPVPRPAGLVAGGSVQSLVASGMLAPRQVINPKSPESFLTLADLRYLKRMITKGQALEANLMAQASSNKVHAFALRQRAHATSAPKG